MWNSLLPTPLPSLDPLRQPTYSFWRGPQMQWPGHQRLGRWVRPEATPGCYGNRGHKGHSKETSLNSDSKREGGWGRQLKPMESPPGELTDKLSSAASWNFVTWLTIPRGVDQRLMPTQTLGFWTKITRRIRRPKTALLPLSSSLSQNKW